MRKEILLVICTTILLLLAGCDFGKIITPATGTGSAPSIGNLTLKSSSNLNLSTDDYWLNFTQSDPESDSVTNISWYNTSVLKTLQLYSFDTNATSPINSIGGFNLFAVSTSPTYTSVGKYGGAFNFSGATGNCFYSTSNSTLVPFNLSVEFWVRFNRFADMKIISVSSASNGYIVGANPDGTIRPETWDNASVYSQFNSSPVILSTNVWYYVVFTRQPGGNMTIYINGTRASTIASTANPLKSSVANFVVGCTSWGNDLTINGSLDDIRINNYIPTPEQIMDNYLYGPNRLDMTIAQNKTWTAHVIPADGTSFGTEQTLVFSATGVNTTNTTSITISNVGVQARTFTTAVINWTTDVASNSTIKYGLTTALGTNQTNTSLVTQHTMWLTGLTMNKTYYFNVSSCVNNVCNQSSSSFNTSLPDIDPALCTSLNNISFTPNTTTSKNVSAGGQDLCGYLVGARNNGSAPGTLYLSLNQTTVNVTMKCYGSNTRASAVNITTTQVALNTSVGVNVTVRVWCWADYYGLNTTFSPFFGLEYR